MYLLFRQRVLCLFALVLSFSSSYSYATEHPQLVTYPAPAEAEKAKDFRVWVNDQEIFLYETVPAALGIFSFSGRVKIRIEPTVKVGWVDFRPKSLMINHTLENNQINFTLDKPVHLSVELNNESKRVLSLFANPLEQRVPSPKNKKVKYFKGGAIYEAGTIELKEGEQLYIEGGAMVRGSVTASNTKDIHISGRGILDGRQLEKGARLIFLDQVTNASIEGVCLVGSKTWTIEPMFCQELLVDNIKIVNWDFGSDGIDLVGSSNVKIKNSFIRANDDCITVKTWGGKEKYPQEDIVGPDVQNIEMTQSVFWNMPWGNALEIGFELRAKTIRNIVFSDCDIIHVERGAAFSIHNGDYATVQDIRYEDIRVEDARHKLIDLAVFLSQYSVDRPEDPEVRKSLYMHGPWDGVLRMPAEEENRYAGKRGSIKNIIFKNIQVVDGPVPFSIISGFDKEHQVENVFIENLTIHGKKVTDLKQGKITTEKAKGVRIQ